MPTVIISKPVEVLNELEKIGLSDEQVLEIVHAMAGAKRDATENDPPGAAGWSAWRMGVRRAREVTIHDKRFPDWERDETGQVSSVVNREIGVRLLVSNTDDGTGIDSQERFPQNRSKKGAATDRIVQTNQGLFEFMEQETNVIAFPKAFDVAQGITSWYVCVYAEGDELRAEVSCPGDIEGGFFTGFKKRIIILGGDGTGIDPVKSKKPDGEVVEFDIPVTRK
jgi:hypothetical protein